MKNDDYSLENVGIQMNRVSSHSLLETAQSVALWLLVNILGLAWL